MTPVEHIVRLARIDLEEDAKQDGSVSKLQLELAVQLAREYAQSRTTVTITDEDAREAIQALEAAFNVYVGNEHVMVNNENHIDWLEAQRAEIDWKYWSRYKNWLVKDELRPSVLVEGSMNDVTDQILSLIESPKRPGSWSRRGLVAGQVQSGKTSNYIGLINKAIDAGYKLIVIFAGTHDNLRSQTQVRVNQGVLGFDSLQNINGSRGKRTGVGVGDRSKPRINCPTSSGQKGDFNRRLAQAVGSLGGDPVILVVKKNVSILKNLFAWSTEMNHEIDRASGKRIVTDVPLLVIDDEADFASIDTGSKRDKVTGEESDPSATNRLIRALLEGFQKSAYVGYTATPFANIFINPAADHDTFGKDLFPEHFIVTLPETSSYAGPARIFGLTANDDSGIEAVEALPTTSTIDDYSTWLPDGHKKTAVPQGDLPESLQRAIRSFLLSVALKRFRKTKMKHTSMLVHVTRFVDVQRLVAEQIDDYVSTVRRELLFLSPEDRSAEVWEQLRSLYVENFEPITDSMLEMPDLGGQIGETPQFERLHDLIRDSVRDVKVERVNGEAGDALQYSSGEPATVIAVGGDKLSRGLTLEGLTTSYYLRASRMYDTLMQMGRWFGYRPGYLDICRLFTTAQLIRWYGRITVASERLYKEFEVMAALGKTPRQFGLRIQFHPDGLMVTAANKSRFAKNVKASFSGTTSESILFMPDRASRTTNWDSFLDLFSSVVNSPEASIKDVRPFYWSNVPPEIVLSFLDKYDAHRSSLRALPKAMAEYIRACNELSPPELSSWDVLIAAVGGSTDQITLPDGRELEMSVRRAETVNDVKRDGTHGTPFAIGRIVNQSDEILPLHGDPRRYERALELAKQNWRGAAKPALNEPSKPTAVSERRTRDTDQGFLILYPINRLESSVPESEEPYVGFAVSFPHSENAPSVNYRVNEIYWDLEMDQTFEEEETDVDE